MKQMLLTLVLCALALPGGAAAQEDFLTMATTTSTDNTGLLDVLGPAFTADTGVELRWVATGTGKALKLGETCDVDVLLVHAPAAEKAFIEKGFGLERYPVMYNDFVLIGPATDPAGIKGKSTAQALSAIASSKAVFVSRGDDSGTHKMELLLWKEAGTEPPVKTDSYLESGQGMLATIRMAEERNGYTLTDRGTYISWEASLQGSAPLVILVEGDKSLFNQYSVVTLNPKNCPNVKQDLAQKFADWMQSDKGQTTVKNFTLEGKQLFTPNAGEQ